MGEVVDNAKSIFHTERLTGNFGPPVSLFNRALGLFDYHLRHLDEEPPVVDNPSPIISLAHQFMFAANRYANESGRVNAVKYILGRVFAAPLNWEVPQARFGIKPDAINHGDNPFVVAVVKNEAGIDGDASLQAALSYAHIATS